MFKKLQSRQVPIFFVFWVIMAFVQGCAGGDDQYVERPAEDIFQEGLREMQNANYGPAAAAFLELEQHHPYSAWATRAQINAAYAYYITNQYDEAVATLDRFMDMHPGHQDIAYAQYLKGMCYYEQISDVERDQSMTEKALESLEYLTVRYPDSSYAKDARYKLDLVRDQLAGKEMEVGRFYLKRENLNAALNRFKNVITHYQTTEQVPEALHRITEIYLALGLMDEAQKTAAVLGHNFPGSTWYQESYALFNEIRNVRESKSTLGNKTKP